MKDKVALLTSLRMDPKMLYQSRYLQLNILAIRLYYEAYSNNQRHKKTLAKVKELEANALLKEHVKEDFNVLCAMISKYQGYRVDPKSTSVREFYSYIELINKESSNNG